MTSEKVTLEVDRFRTPDGQPTCCSDVEKGHICLFMGTSAYGTRDVCMFGEQKDLRRGSYRYYTVPHKDCPLWTGANKPA